MEPAATNLIPLDVHKAFEVETYRVSGAQYLAFRRDGFLIVRGLINPREVAELQQHTSDLMLGKLPEQRGHTMADRDRSKDHGVAVQGLEAPPEHLSAEEKADFFLRIHMLHRKLGLHEKYLLHPRVADVLEVLIGPDVLALQSMLFLKGPGKPGQGWHQDSYYIPTSPDTLCGAWIAIDDVDEYNGAMWFAKGSGNEPVYPPCPEVGYGFGDKLVSDIKYVKGVSNDKDEENHLAPVADKYDQLLATMKAGDVAFFNGHVLHRSKRNITKDRFRRSFVGHYCNARSFTQWGADNDAPPPVLRSSDNAGSFTTKHAQAAENAAPVAPVPPAPALPGAIDPVTRMSNGSHILVRGDTHLPFARPRFGTPCAALMPAEERAKRWEYAARIIAETGNGLLGCAIADPTVEHDHDDEKAKAGY
jgi:phytanoyl-CoA hydroxylase